MSARLSGVWPWLAAVASGGLLALSFPSADQAWLVWIALVPLVCAVWFGERNAEAKVDTQKVSKLERLQPALLGYVAGLTFFTLTFSWLSELAPLFGAPMLRTLPFLLALYMGLYFAFWGWFLAWILPRRDAAQFTQSARNLLVGVLAASAWVAQEWVRGWLFSGFGWNTLGVALHRDLAMMQIVAITGAPGLSWLIAFCNVMAVVVVRRMIADLGPQFLKRMRWEFSATVALVALVWAYGTRTLLRGDSTPTVPLRVAAIQSNIPQRDKFNPEQEEEIFATFDRLTGLVLTMQPQPHLVLWPESATPRGLFADQANHDFVFEQVERSDAALLFGTTDLDYERGDDYNVAVLLSDRGERLQMHRKIHLVPFGEYLPLRPMLGSIVGDLVAADFTPGEVFTVLKLDEPDVSLSALICFEDTLAYLSRQFVGRGAQLLVNITNDGWFGRSTATRQHLANAVFRAVENRRPLVRCANTGVTGVVNANGFFERWVPEFEEGISVGEIAVPTSGATTFFTRHGDVLSPASAVVAVLAIAGGWMARRRAAAISPLRT